MPISIILDKSTFQSLNVEEIFFLQRYYTVTIAPVLLLEILADLRKKKKGYDPEVRVADFAKKILRLNPQFTTHYKQLINSSLLGDHVYMDGRPLISGGRTVTTQDGKRGVVFEQSPEEKAMHRWRNAQFTEAEDLLAKRWREAAEVGNSLEALKQIFLPNPEIRSLEDLNAFIEKYLSQPEHQSATLVGIIDIFSVDYTVAPKVFNRFDQAEPKQISEFAPYAYYCFKIFLFFELGIINGLLGTRSTNQIDLQYLYYLPFCKAFSSGDKFHESMVHFFLEADRDFISGSELKADLKEICNSKNRLTGDERTRWMEIHKNHPPENTNSITYRIWKKYARPSVFTDDETPLKLSREAHDKIINDMHKYMNSPTDQTKRPFMDSEADFIIQESSIYPEDYCPCGSGQIFRECHLPEVIKSQQSSS